MSEGLMFATVEQIAERLGEPIEQELQPRVERFLRRAHRKLEALEPRLQERVESGDVDREAVTDVIVEAVWRAVQDDLIGWRVRSEQFPENTMSFQDAEQTGVYFTADELQDLGIVTRSHAAGVFSISKWSRS